MLLIIVPNHCRSKGWRLACGSGGLLGASSTFFRPVLIRGPQEGKRISLTFDDGPTEQFTEQVLDILHEHTSPPRFRLREERGKESRPPPPHRRRGP